MRNLRITVQYDGTDYHGWQMQAAHRTIQGELTRVLSLLDRREVVVHGAGRTDAGVHALGQVANFSFDREIDEIRLRDAINNNLDRDIRVLDVTEAPPDFHARLRARRKAYRYRIWNSDVADPFDYRYSYHYRGVLDICAMSAAAGQLWGEHDFSAFTVSSCEAGSRVRTLEKLEVSRDGPNVHIVAEANGFLRYMVRSLAGTLIEVGKGNIPVAAVTRILEEKKRESAGPTLPASGLTLVRVDY